MSRIATPRDLIPEAHYALGTLLRPFSLGHHLLLIRAGLTFPENPRAFTTPEQLALGIFICAAPYAQMLEAMLRGDWEAEHAAWTRRLKPRFWQRTRFIHEQEAACFCEYLLDGYRRAPVLGHGGGGIAFSAPWEMLLECRLVGGGFNSTEVLEMYLPAAWYRYHTLFEIMQADNLTDRAKWRRVFWNNSDAAAYAAGRPHRTGNS